MDWEPVIIVSEAMRHLSFLSNLMLTTIVDLQLTDGVGNVFATFESEIRLFHSGFIAVLNAADLDPAEFLCFGLRISDQSWQNPPETGMDAVQEVRLAWSAVNDALSEQAGDCKNAPVPGYFDIFHDEFSSVYNRVGETFDFISGLTQPTSVVHALRHLYFVVNITFTTILDADYVYGDVANLFVNFEQEIRTMHRGVLALANGVNINPATLVSAGLRISESSWANPPPNAIAGLREVQRLLSIIKGVLHDIGDIEPVLPGYCDMFFGRFSRIFGHMTTIFYWLAHNIAYIEVTPGDEGIDPMAEAQGAAEEDIENIPVHIAGNEEAECSVCLDHITLGQEMKTLPCGHVYHAGCINSWLRVSSCCPMDRTDPFNS